MKCDCEIGCSDAVYTPVMLNPEANECDRILPTNNRAQLRGSHALSNDLRLLVNAIISMNTVAEFVALDRLKYCEVSLEVLAKQANDIREQFACLKDLKFCAETLKHVRKLTNLPDSDVSVTPSSTSILPPQPRRGLSKHRRRLTI